MKITFATILITFSFHLVSFSQVTYNSIYSENPPAFAILGIEPTSIERPSTPQVFATSLQNAVSGNKLAPGFALETAPRLWFPTNNYTTQEFLKDRNFFKYLPQHISLSLATSNADTVTYGNLSPGLGWSIGGKLLILSGNPTKPTTDKLQDIQNQLSVISDFNCFKASLFGGNTADTNQIKAIAVLCKSSNPSHTGSIDLVVKQIIEHMRKNNQTTISSAGIDSLTGDNNKKLANTTINIQREGSMLELAGAGMTVVQNNEWKKSVYGAKWGIWLNYSYQKSLSGLAKNNSAFDFGFVARFIYNKKTTTLAVDSSNYLDFGAKAGFQISKFHISSEYVFRYLTTKPISINKQYTWKWTLNLEYQITNNISAKLSFGKGFDGNSNTYDTPAKFLGIAGLNFSLPQSTKSN